MNLTSANPAARPKIYGFGTSQFPNFLLTAVLFVDILGVGGIMVLMHLIIISRRIIYMRLNWRPNEFGITREMDMFID